MANAPLDVFVLVAQLSEEPPVAPFTDENVRWLFDRSRSFSLARFWTDESGGMIELDATVHPMQTVQVNIADQQLFTAPRSRDVAAETALRLVESAGVALGSGGKAVVLFGGLAVNVGPAHAVLDGREWEVAFVDMAQTHSSLCRQIGRLLGLEPTQDLRVPSGVAGRLGFAPLYDILRDDASSTFAAPPEERAFAPDAPLWTACGPGVSPTVLWRYGPDFPALPSWAVRLEADAPSTKLELSRTGAPMESRPRLAVIPARSGSGWYAVEYRPRSGWSREATTTQYPDCLFVHEIRDHVVTDVLGASRTVRDAVCAHAALGGYVLNVWGDGHLAVRREKDDGTVATVRIGHGPVDAPNVRLDVDVESTRDRSEASGETAVVSKTGRECRARAYDVQRIYSHATVRAALRVRGLADPYVRFELNGYPVGTWMRVGNASGVVELGQAQPWVFVRRPLTLRTAEVHEDRKRMSVRFEADVLTVEIATSDEEPGRWGRFDLSIAGYVSDGPVADLPAIDGTSVDVYPALGAVRVVSIDLYELALPPEVVQHQAECLFANLNHARTDWVWLHPIEEPDWSLRLEVRDALTIRDFVAAGPSLLQLARDAAGGDVAAQMRLEEAARLLEVEPAALHAVAREFEIPAGF